MAATYDGSIRINTKIDSRDAKTQLNSLSRSLKNFAVVVGVAFGVGAIVSFGKECVNLASDLNEVQNVIETTFGDSVGLIEQFADTAATSFGLSELAAKRYTGTMGAMLKSMGFAERAAADMSIEMAALAGDMASFYNLSTDEAFNKIRSGISGETEPLKQLGINLSVANLEAYALAQGIKTSYNALSEQNKALLRYNYLMDVTSDAQGDFAKTSNSWANQVRILALQWESMKATLGGAFIQVLTPVLQMLNLIIGRLNAAAESFANFIAVVTGNTQKFKETSAAATGAVEGLADATTETGDAAEKAGKKAGKSLAAFDELNTLSGGSGGESAIAIPGVAVTEEVVSANKEAEDSTDLAVRKMEAKLFGFLMEYADEVRRVKDSWEELKRTVGGVFNDIAAQFAKVAVAGTGFEMLMNFIYAILEGANLLIGVAGKLFVALNVPAFIQSALLYLSSLFRAIGDIIVAITPGIMDFVNKALVPIAHWIGEKLRHVLDFFAEQLKKIGDWFADHEEQFSIILGFLGDIAAAIWAIIEPLLDSAWEDTKVLISTLIDLILALVGTIINLVALILTLPDTFSEAWIKITEVWGNASEWFEINVLTPIKTAFKDAINFMIGIAEGFVNGFIRGINAIIDALNSISIDVPDGVPYIGGTKFGIDIPNVRSISIPRLAQGAVIPPNREFMAILGDQKRGTNIEAPLSTIEQAVRNVFGERSFKSSGNAIVILQVDGRELARVMVPYNEGETQRLGTKLIER